MKTKTETKNRTRERDAMTETKTKPDRLTHRRNRGLGMKDRLKVYTQIHAKKGTYRKIYSGI